MEVYRKAQSRKGIRRKGEILKLLLSQIVRKHLDELKQFCRFVNFFGYFVNRPTKCSAQKKLTNSSTFSNFEIKLTILECN